MGALQADPAFSGSVFENLFNLFQKPYFQANDPPNPISIECMLTNRIVQFLPKVIRKLQMIYHRNAKTPNATSITSLAPVDWADADEIYTNTLRAALENRDKLDIRNIAVTGPFGSGKSSIIKTFQRKVFGQGYHFLNISLATFKEELVHGATQPPDTSVGHVAKPDEKDQQEQLRLIELSILQQIFYAEKPDDIPDSRFKRIHDLRNWKIAALSFGVMLYFGAIFFLTKAAFFGNQIHELLKSFWWYVALQWIACSIFFVGSWYVLAKSIRTVSKLRLTKISIQDADFEVDQNSSKSILNHHIDELIYFFEVTKYNVVIIEDLDRFQQTEIFTKLREINLLINKSKRINRNIVFVYAVRDDLFKENERTKFFDFILPVIPVINSSNSSQKLLEKKRTMNYQWKEDIIEDLAIFIDDMRLLHNITNEFQLYRSKLSAELDENKLLAMLVYKNLYPGDFSRLSEGGGSLYASINLKSSLIQEKEALLNQKISDLNSSIDLLEQLTITDLRELNALYLLRVTSGLTNFVGFVINGQTKTLDEMLDEENFAYVIKGEAKYNYSQNGYSNQLALMPKLSADIEKAVDKNRTYRDRKRLIIDFRSNILENYKVEILKLQNEKSALRNTPLSALLPDDREVFLSGSEKQRALISLLLRNGYIAEDYADYISLFYEGSLTKADFGFVLKVKSRQGEKFDYSIIKLPQIIKKISLVDFGKHYILNYRLIDFLLSSGEYQEHLSSVMNLLKDETGRSVQFIDGMLDHSTELPMFATNLCSAWHNIWTFIEARSNYPLSKVDRYFWLIMHFAKELDIVKIAQMSGFVKYALSKPDFLTNMPDTTRLELVVTTLQMKFVELDESNVTGDQANFIHKNSAYELNVDMVALITKKIGTFDQVLFDNSNYLFVQKSNCQYLIAYVDRNIDDYVQNVFLAIPTNLKEEQNSYLSLLNHEEIGEELLLQVIKKVDTIISDIQSIRYPEVAQMLFEQGKIEATWSNIYEQYMECDQAFPDFLVTFINQELHANELAAGCMAEISFRDATKQPFLISFLEDNEIEDTIYAQLLPSVETPEDDFDIAHLTAAKVTSLIQQIRLPPNSSSLEKVKKSHPLYQRIFLEHYKAYILENWDTFELESRDIDRMLASNAYSRDEKQKVLDQSTDSQVTSSSGVLKSLTGVLVNSAGIRLRPALLDAVLLNASASSEDRIVIFNTMGNNVQYLDKFIRLLDTPYASIGMRGQKPKLPKTDYNLRFAEILQARKFISSFKENEDNIKIYTFIKD